jgi:20S proteasome alpha/beta subunit
MAESLWEADLAPEDLFETISQTLLNAVDRDAYSGWGAVVWIIEKVRSVRFWSSGGAKGANSHVSVLLLTRRTR